jgi:hypothetical protein
MRVSWKCHLRTVLSTVSPFTKEIMHLAIRARSLPFADYRPYRT